jgi:hypothetical protein
MAKPFQSLCRRYAADGEQKRRHGQKFPWQRTPPGLD